MYEAGGEVPKNLSQDASKSEPKKDFSNLSEAIEKFKNAIPFSKNPQGFSSFGRIIPDDTKIISNSLFEIGISPVQIAFALEYLFVQADKPQEPLNLKNQQIARWYEFLSDTLHTVTTYRYLRDVQNGMSMLEKPDVVYTGQLTPAQLLLPLEERWRLQNNIPSTTVMTRQGANETIAQAQEVIELSRKKSKRLKRVTEYDEYTGAAKYKTTAGERSRRKTRKYDLKYLTKKLAFEKKYLQRKVEEINPSAPNPT